MQISKRTMLKGTAIASVGMALAACNNSGGSTPAESADEYPTKEITVLVPYGPGGGTDTITRTLVPHMEKELGQRLLVVNRPGGSGAVAINEAIEADPNGYTLIMGAAAPVIAAPRFNDVGYTPEDLIAIGRAVASPDCLVATESSPFQTADEFFEAVEKGDQVTVGVAGATGMQAIIINLMNSNLGSNITAVPFDGAADAIAAVRAGDVHTAMGTTLDVGPTVTSGDAKVLAATDPERIPEALATDVPSLADYGAEIPADSNWYGLMGQKDLPADLVEKLAKAVENAMNQEDVISTLEGIGALPGFLGPEEFAASIDEQWAAYEDIDVAPAE